LNGRRKASFLWEFLPEKKFATGLDKETLNLYYRLTLSSQKPFELASWLALLDLERSQDI
jgi:hypothetical protein